MSLIITSRLISENGFDWLAIIGLIILVATIIHFFIERKKLNQLK